MAYKSTPEELYLHFSALFEAGRIKRADLVWDQVSTITKSTSETEQYDWFEAIPFPEEWKGHPSVSSPRTIKFQVFNRDYVLTQEIADKKFRDQTLEHLVAREGNRMSAMGQRFSEHREAQVMALYQAGASTNCYDGVPLWSAVHPRNGGTLTNYDNSGAKNLVFFLDTDAFCMPVMTQIRQEPTFDSIDERKLKKRMLYIGDDRKAFAPGLWESGFASNGDFNGALIDTAFESMAAVTDEEGGKLGLSPKVVLYGASRRAEVLDILARQLVSGGDSNRHAGTLRAVYSPYL